MKGNFCGISGKFFFIYTLAKFCQNVVSLLTSTAMVLARAHAQSYSRLKHVFAKLIKTQVTGMPKKFYNQNFGGINLTADSTAKSACLGKSSGR